MNTPNENEELPNYVRVREACLDLAAFSIGVVDVLSDRGIDSPLTTIALCAVNGCAYSFMARLISHLMLPGDTKWLVPAVAVAYTVHAYGKRKA